MEGYLWVYHEGDVRQFLSLPQLKNETEDQPKAGGHRKRGPTEEVQSSAAAQFRADMLSDCAHAILKVLTTGALRGQAIATKAGYDYDYVRHELADLQKQDLIRKSPEGYALTTLASEVLPYLRNQPPQN